jgi:hypothetical protein
MQLRNEIREGLKAELTDWLSNRVWSEDEIHPFGDLNPLANEFRVRVLPFGIQFKSIETFGETITFNSEWDDEGLWFQTNINPTIQRDGFRVVFRWKESTTIADTNANSEN